jgi:hypothetical protein
MDQNNGGILGKINTPTTSVASGVWSLDSQFESQSSSIWPLAFPQTTIANSLRLDDSSNRHLSKSISGTSTTKLTISFWTKRTDGAGADDYLVFNSENNSSNYLSISFGNPKIDVQIGGTANRRITNSVYRDQSAWYHVVITFDTTQSTASDRIKIYINGVQETSFATSTTGMSQDSNLPAISSTLNYAIGDYPSVSGFGYNGYLAEFIAAYGQALDPTSFGAFNPVTNIWEPIAYAGTYGSNGFRLDFADSSALGNDVSGNDNDFTVNNLTSVDQSTDTCSNNFALINALAAQGGSAASSSVITFTEGNLVVDAISSETAIASIGVDTGKWYWEVKVLTDQDGLTIGGANQHFNLDAELGYNSPSSPSEAKIFGYYGGTGVYANTVGDGNQFTTYGTSVAVNDIIGVALNLDDNQVTFYKNGTAQNSGTAASLTALGTGEQYFPAVGNWSGAAVKLSFNFGSPQFSISSGNSDANGHGNFEYSVPSGYFALCTKNLAENG